MRAITAPSSLNRAPRSTSIGRTMNGRRFSISAVRKCSTDAEYTTLSNLQSPFFISIWKILLLIPFLKEVQDRIKVSFSTPPTSPTPTPTTPPTPPPTTPTAPTTPPTPPTTPPTPPPTPPPPTTSTPPAT